MDKVAVVKYVGENKFDLRKSLQEYLIAAGSSPIDHGVNMGRIYAGLKATDHSESEVNIVINNISADIMSAIVFSIVEKKAQFVVEYVDKKDLQKDSGKKPEERNILTG